MSLVKLSVAFGIMLVTLLGFMYLPILVWRNTENEFLFIVASCMMVLVFPISLVAYNWAVEE